MFPENIYYDKNKVKAAAKLLVLDGFIPLRNANCLPVCS